MKLPTQNLLPLVDLTNCDREPIHTPGAIQPHGFLFVLSETDLTITHASENVGELLGQTLDQILAQEFSQFILAESRTEVETLLRAEHLERNNPFVIDLQTAAGTRRFSAIAHRHAGRLILELEASVTAAKGEFAGFYHESRVSISRLRSSRSLEELFAATVSEIRRITGFDRVTLYKFDENWNGHVLAEEVKAGTASYLDLHFPASDIPAQARELYRLNRVRIIPRVPYTLVPLRVAAGQAADPVDLSLSALRSVSPIHLEYLKNMDATASMSISLLQEGRLWGLISNTHESGTLPVTFEARAVCDLIGEITSSLLSLRESAESQNSAGQKSALQAQLLEIMSREDDFVTGIEKNETEFLSLVGAPSGAIYHQGRFRMFGRGPAPEQVQTIARWLGERPKSELTVTDALPALLPEAHEFRDTACGLVAFALSRPEGTSVMWFRPEVVQTVKWGGDPTKPVDPENNRVLHPRKSFEAWKETVRGKSLPWRKVELEAAIRFRSSIIDVVLQKMERISNLNRELERSNVELDSFAYAASHDLKEPLRGIHNYSALLLRTAPARLLPEEVTRLQTIGRLSQRMEDLINSLLNYSLVGRAEMSMAPNDLNEALKIALDSLLQRIDEAHADVRTVATLPTIVCDRSQVIEVFTNLISNAIKYNDREQKIVEVGVLDMGEGDPVLFVRDNGIGIEHENHVGIFKIFRRLHGKDKYGGGTGTGLTITEKIVQRHGGKIWIESIPGKGTTFFFTLGPRVRA